MSRPTPPSVCRPLILFALGIGAFATAAVASNIRVLEDTLAVSADQVVDIHLPFGDILVDAAESNEMVEASLTVECDRQTEKCRTRAERVELIVRTKGQRLVVEVKGAARASATGLTLRLRVGVPAHQTVEIDLGAGNVSTRGLLGAVEVDVGVGDVEIRVPQSDLRRVQIDTGIGTSRLTTDLGDVRGAGVVRSGLVWSQAVGTAEVEVDTGIGDILVDTLTPP